MDKFVIEGGYKLNGSVKISGAKNAALPAMAASILTTGDVFLKGVPALLDVITMQKLLIKMGAEIKEDKDGSDTVLKINTSNLNTYEAPYELVKTMRASILVLGPMVARFGKARVSMPGGCAIGERPVNLHLKGLEALGAKVSIDHGYIDVAAGSLKGAKIVFDEITVTGTENIIMTAIFAKGTTIIENAAKEPEVVSLADQLNLMGAKIHGAGTNKIVIEGIDRLHGCTYDIIPDRIEAGTYIIAASAGGNEVEVKGCIPRHIDALLFKLKEAGIRCREEKNRIIVKNDKKHRLMSVSVKTMPYPNFPTDLQAQFMVLMTQGNSSSIITETIFENRFMHVAELRRMGADIKIEGNVAKINGKTKLMGTQLMATDLRASASLVIAGLIAEGTTEISRIYHLDRGYETMEKKLSILGAKVRRINV
ncbi:MAG: UDP-N-acetylglucosamine 1-carboxyvinyltransferase [Deltaproteobacteria bacterium]|nr:UDP-N-acetylglucosamine 1-carboxyvinyltransferase [Deltaproteobacteria bacterium]MCL5792088.1 UDP-N-acetylglucosamine 1-carboxyvinyltransferase [Deltaproteobacteria bacterium]